MLCLSLVNAQEEDLKVGLVLSGGGAKGLAHIGVLKVLEEAGVRVDYIGGTSMGAIVGALYASGYSAKQIDSIFSNSDLEELIQGNVPRSSMSFYEKQNAEKYALTLPFNNFKISIPQSISTGQKIYNRFAEVLFHVNDIEDYNELPIPFFCMATDVETGDPVKLDSGYLPLSISASGAFPSLFEPVDIDGRLLIDGGVVNNYPIDSVRAMGADIVIGVDVQDALAKREDLKSATGVLMQINNYRTVRDMEQKRSRTDLYIKPDIKEYSVISFSQSDSIIKSGYRQALKHKGELESIASRQGFNRDISINTRLKDSFQIAHVLIDGNKKYSRAYVKGKIRYENYEPTNFDEFENGINTLVATNNFESVRYVIRPEGEGYNVNLKLRESQTDMFLKLGVHYDGLYGTGGLINLTRKNLLVSDDALSFDFVLGDQIRYELEYFIDKGTYWSLGFRSRFNSFVQDIDFNFANVRNPGGDIPGVNRIDLEVRDFTNQFYVQTLWGEQFVFGLGLEHKYLKLETKTIIDEQDDFIVFNNSNYLSTYGFLKLDTLDDKYFPTTGFFFDGDFHLYFLSTDFDDQDFNEFSIAKARMGFAFPITGNLAFNFFTEGGFYIGNTDVNSLDFILGGYGNDLINNFTPFLGYDFISFGGDSYVKATFTTDWEFIRNNHLNFKANFSNAADGIFKTGEWFTLPDYTGYAVGYSFESFLGPLEVKYTWSPEASNDLWVFNVGFWF
nr:patatin-like phospholipase family protein [Robertkochia sp. 3YJGBD-33]